MIAFISGNHTEPDIASELFILDTPIKANSTAQRIPATKTLRAGQTKVEPVVDSSAMTVNGGSLRAIGRPSYEQGMPHRSA